MLVKRGKILRQPIKMIQQNKSFFEYSILLFNLLHHLFCTALTALHILPICPLSVLSPDFLLSASVAPPVSAAVPQHKSWRERSPAPEEASRGETQSRDALWHLVKLSPSLRIPLGREDGWGAAAAAALRPSGPSMLARRWIFNARGPHKCMGSLMLSPRHILSLIKH